MSLSTFLPSILLNVRRSPEAAPRPATLLCLMVHQPARRRRSRATGEGGAGTAWPFVDYDDDGRLRPSIPARRRFRRARSRGALAFSLTRHERDTKPKTVIISRSTRGLKIRRAYRPVQGSVPPPAPWVDRILFRYFMWSWSRPNPTETSDAFGMGHPASLPDTRDKRGPTMPPHPHWTSVAFAKKASRNRVAPKL